MRFPTLIQMNKRRSPERLHKTNEYIYIYISLRRIREMIYESVTQWTEVGSYSHFRNTDSFDPIHFYPVTKTRVFIRELACRFRNRGGTIEKENDSGSRTLDGRKKCPRGRRRWSSTGGRTDWGGIGVERGSCSTTPMAPSYIEASRKETGPGGGEREGERGREWGAKARAEDQEKTKKGRRSRRRRRRNRATK